MDLLGGYASSSDSDSPPATKAAKPGPKLSGKATRTAIMAAPRVVGATSGASSALCLVQGQKEMKTNLTTAVVCAPMNGPAHPWKKAPPAGSGTGAGAQNFTVRKAAVEDWSFSDQFNAFNNSGRALDAAGGAGEASYVGGGAAAAAAAAAAVGEKPRSKKRRRGAAATAANAAAAAAAYDVSATSGGLPWAAEPDEGAPSEADAAALEALRAELAGPPKKEVREIDQDEFEDRRDERKISHLLPARHDRDTEESAATSTFHGAAETDYQGRSWAEPPLGARPGDGDHEARVPKRCVHKYNGHTKGVQAIKWFPKYGHLLLSASMDGTVKIWDAAGKGRKCLRTYNGHSAAVRNVNFNQDGSQFITCGFDRFIRTWDTETGKVLTTFTNRKMAYCVHWHPNHQNEVIAGCSDAKIYQFDDRSNKVTQKYDHHIQAVNSVTYVDGGRRFVSTSDDKKILIWESGIPVPIKYISEPHMHSMPTVALHPSGNFFAGQSMNNEIHVYSAKDRFKMQRKMLFKGHLNAGYAVDIGFSPNGRFLVSGDAEGHVAFYDWKSHRLFSKIKAHDNGPCIGVAYHPIEVSTVATCGWDSVIKLWQ